MGGLKKFIFKTPHKYQWTFMKARNIIHQPTNQARQHQTRTDRTDRKTESVHEPWAAYTHIVWSESKEKRWTDQCDAPTNSSNEFSMRLEVKAYLFSLFIFMHHIKYLSLKWTKLFSAQCALLSTALVSSPYLSGLTLDMLCCILYG